MKWEWSIANSCKRPCMGVQNLARISSYTTLKTALFDGKFRPKMCGTVIPHRDCSRGDL